MPALDMALTEAANLVRRQNRNDCSYVDRYGRCYSTWDRWARWVVLGIIILGALFIFFLFSCISARRRRRMGYAPYRGTGWAAGRPPPGHGPAQYNASPYYGNQNQQTSSHWGGQQQQQPYNPPPTYGASQDYYGQNRGDVELQSPQQAHTYGGGSGGYAPPPGPPPGKQGNDGIIR